MIIGFMEDYLKVAFAIISFSTKINPIKMIGMTDVAKIFKNK